MDPSLQTFDQGMTDIMLVIGHNPSEAKKVKTKLATAILADTIVSLIASDKEQKAYELIDTIKQNPKDLLSIIAKNFKEDQIIKSYAQSTYKIMEKYFSEVSPALDENQIQRIVIILNKMQKDLH